MKKGNLIGVVVSDKMDQTVIVKKERFKKHKLYDKKYLVSKRFKVHDPHNNYKIGDKVKFQTTKPISKEKHWIVCQKEK